jgi:N-acetyltransferase 10
VLLPPIKDDESHLPEPLVVLQVALEGKISQKSILDGLSRGLRAGGDMIPWLISQQFQENKFAQLCGARVVRIATHPDYASVCHVSVILKSFLPLTACYRWDTVHELCRR